MIQKKQVKIRFVLISVSAVAVGFLFYRESVASVIDAVLNRQGSSHGVFVPFLSAYFLWLKRDKLKKKWVQYDYAGAIPVIAGVLLGITNFGGYQLNFFGFIVFISGLVTLFLGRQFFTEVSFPLFFLVAMIPIPVEVYNDLAAFTRSITLEGSIQILSITGIPYFRDGIMVQLPNALLNVNLSCSGIRYLVSYFVFGLAYAYLFRKKLLSRVLVVFSTIPISIMASIFRLMAIFLLTYFFGPRMAEHWPHIFISWTNFLLILFSIIAADQFIYSRHILKSAVVSRPKRRID